MDRLTTSPLHSKLVVYNRVSKCASSTMIWVAKKSAERVGYDVKAASLPVMSKQFRRSTQKLIAKYLSSLKTNTIFIRHFFFFNFTQFGAPPPVYINVIRDPVDRFISRFYFSRYGFMWKKSTTPQHRWKKSNVSVERMNKSLEDCMAEGAESCLRKENYMPIVSFFCDDDGATKCKELSERTLQRSMKNVERHYAVVGLQEDLPNTLAMLEAILPEFFQEPNTLLESSPETNRTKSRNRMEPSPEVKLQLRQALQIDVAFYDFVKARFYKQLNELKRKKLIQHI